VNGYAGIVTRTIALAADALVLNVGLAVTTTIVGLALSVFGTDLTDLEMPGLLAGLGSWFVVTAIYFIGFWTLAEQTPGMRALRLEVVSTGGERLGLWQGVRRFVGMILAALPLMAGYALILWDPRRQGLHDKLAGSVVRYRRSGTDPMTVAPAPGVEPIVSSPPIASSRSRMLVRPAPAASASVSKPTPSSRTSKLNASLWPSLTVMVVAPACLAAFWSASRQQKYTALSTSCG
jgi:uncharacterized RDD family membrane protein YckC